MGPADARVGADRVPAGSGAAQVFVDDLGSDPPELCPEDVHHLRNVLRLRAGERVVVSDGRGRTRVHTVGSGRDLLRAEGPVLEQPRPSPEVTIAFVAVKGGRPELVVQKLTELGVDRMAVLLHARRSVVRWDAVRGAAAAERLRRVARSAAAQSRRSWLPEVDTVASLDDLRAELDGHLALAQPGGVPLGALIGRSLRPEGRGAWPAVVVGPEGGWDPDELAGVPDIVGLGPGVLRAETAAIAAGVLLCASRDGIVGGSLG